LNGVGLEIYGGQVKLNLIDLDPWGIIWEIIGKMAKKRKKSIILI
jgi:hypothetical protein